MNQSRMNTLRRFHRKDGDAQQIIDYFNPPDEDDAGDKSGHIRQTQGLQAAKPTPLQDQEEPVAATPAVLSSDKAKELGKPFEPQADKFAAAIIDLGKRPLTRQTVELAKEYDVAAIAYLNDLKASELRRQTDSAFQLHRFLTGVIAKLSTPADTLRRTCASIFRSFDQQEREKQIREQREREAAIRKQQEAERAAEKAALEAAGEVEAAQVLESTPLPAISSPAPKEAVKIDGVSVVYSAGWGEITDIMAFAKWLGEHPEHVAGLEPKMSYWKSMLSAHLNKTTGQMSIEIPGLKIAVTSSSRHRANE